MLLSEDLLIQPKKNTTIFIRNKIYLNIKDIKEINVIKEIYVKKMNKCHICICDLCTKC